MQTLDRLGVAENTLLMFSSDNGPEVPTVYYMRYDNHRLLQEYQLPDTAPDAPGQLYDVETDPGETKNLSLERPEIVNELRSLLEESIASGRSVPPRQ